MLKSNFSGKVLECGCDEAGRGCLAGPVVAAAVILPPDFKNELLNDSKQLSAKQRNELRKIIEKEALVWAVAFIENKEIDKLNILQASIKAIHQAIEKLTIRPEFILVDGNRFKPFEDIPYETIVKGDAKYFSIAAASVLAKSHRDEIMCGLHQQYPVYAWDRNKAYPTKEHRAAIAKYGITKYHRRSFRLM